MPTQITLANTKPSIKIDEEKTFYDKKKQPKNKQKKSPKTKTVSVNSALQKALEKKFQSDEINHTQEETRNK